MFSEQRTLRQHAGQQPKIEISMDALMQAGNDLMGKSGNVEHGYALAGSLVADGRGGVTAKVNRVLSLGAGDAGTFDISPQLARDIGDHHYGPGEQFMGVAHSHRRMHADRQSRPDVDYARRLTNQRVCMMIKLNEDEHGHRDGGAKLSVFNGNGNVDYAIVGNGHRQEFKAARSGVVDSRRLKSPNDPPAPEALPRGRQLRRAA